MSAEMENVRNTFKETLKLNEKYLKCSCVSYGKGEGLGKVFRNMR